MRNVNIGEGRAKICIPACAKKKDELISEARTIMEMRPDLIEWRADYFEEICDIHVVLDTLAALRKTIKETPLIFTCRTENEGGGASICDETRFELRLNAIEAELIDILDIELQTDEEYYAPLISSSKNGRVFICISKHYFESTPDVNKMTNELLMMQALGADIAKLAVMPSCPLDVLNLLYATERFCRQGNIPAITVAMSEMGLISRAAGGVFGSSVTFGAGVNSTAPGQIDAGALRYVCELFDVSMLR